MDDDGLDRQLTLLASPERREVLRHFIATDTEVATIEVLRCKLARIDAGDGTGEPPSTDAAGAALHHVHLPKLAEQGLVEYDPRSGSVRYQPDDRVEALVRFLAER